VYVIINNMLIEVHTNSLKFILNFGTEISLVKQSRYIIPLHLVIIIGLDNHLSDIIVVRLCPDSHYYNWIH